MQATDRHIELITEVFSVLRMIKSFGWETLVKSQINATRAEELRWTFRREMLHLANILMNIVIPMTHMVVTFIVYTVVMERRLTASVVYSAVGGFDMLRRSLWVLGSFIPQLVQANVSIKRVQDFLNDTELLDEYLENVPVLDATHAHAQDVGISQASFFWADDHATNGGLRPAPPTVLAPYHRRDRLQARRDQLDRRSDRLREELALDGPSRRDALRVLRARCLGEPPEGGRRRLLCAAGLDSVPFYQREYPLWHSVRRGEVQERSVTAH
jgi:ABC-type multidrug transport system fused ATPase/permease subunit